MEMKEICIEKVANGFVIECVYKRKQKAMKDGVPEMYDEGRKIEHVALNEKEAMKKVKELIGKFGKGMDDGES